MRLKDRFRPKSIACYILAAVLFAWARPAPWSLLVVIPLLVLGELVRIWGCGHLRKNEAVITSGPYSYIRDPLYLGTLAILTGMTVASRTYEMLALVWGMFFFYYMPYKSRREGDRLARRFGSAYEEYRKAVRCLWPRFPAYRGPDADVRWSGRLAVDNSEMGTAVVVALAYVALALKMFFFPDWGFPSWHLL